MFHVQEKLRGRTAYCAPYITKYRLAGLCLQLADCSVALTMYSTSVQYTRLVDTWSAGKTSTLGN